MKTAKFQFWTPCYKFIFSLTCVKPSCYVCRVNSVNPMRSWRKYSTNFKVILVYIFKDYKLPVTFASFFCPEINLDIFVPVASFENKTFKLQKEIYIENCLHQIHLFLILCHVRNRIQSVTGKNVSIVYQYNFFLYMSIGPLFTLTGRSNNLYSLTHCNGIYNLTFLYVMIISGLHSHSHHKCHSKSLVSEQLKTKEKFSISQSV